MMQNKKDLIIKLARDSILSILNNKPLVVSKSVKDKLSQKQGVFVTLSKFDELRGCIGYTLPYFSLWEGIVNASRAAAFKDDRFTPLKKDEFNKIKIDVSVLSLPKKIVVSDKKEYLTKIKIGVDGLIIKYKGYSGVLLPQVALEYNWSVKEFLANLCLKAGLTKDCYLDKDALMYKFQAEIFTE